MVRALADRGTPVDVHAPSKAITSWVSLWALQLTSSSFVLLYQDQDDSKRLKAVAGTVSGTAITLGAAATLHTDSPYESFTTSMCVGACALDSGRAVFFWGHNAGSQSRTRIAVGYQERTEAVLYLHDFRFTLSMLNAADGWSGSVWIPKSVEGAFVQLSINWDHANALLYLTVDGASAHVNAAGNSLFTSQLRLTPNLLGPNPMKNYIDDLLVLPDAHLEYSADSIAHASSGQPWVDALRELLLT